MEPNEPPRSPFRADFSAPEPAEPVVVLETAEPEQPRLGIIHLLVWTACVAFYLGLHRIFVADAPQEVHDRFMIFGAVQSMGMGAAFGGLLLWAARRYRGWSFPRYPGEYLLVALGLAGVITLTLYGLFGLVTKALGPYTPWFAMAILFAAYAAVQGVVFLVPALRIKIPRWRWFFFSVAGVSLIGVLLPCAGPEFWGACLQILHLVPDAVLVVTVLVGWRQERRFPWTHWLGVVINLWFGVVGLGSLVVNIALR